RRPRRPIHRGQPGPRSGTSTSAGGPVVSSSSSRWRQPLYVWTVFAGAVLVLVAMSPGMGGLGDAFDTGSYYALWATMILVAAMSPLPLPWSNASASLSPALDLAAILVFGPAVACWVGVLSRLITNASHRWRPMLPAVLGVGQTVLA